MPELDPAAMPSLEERLLLALHDRATPFWDAFFTASHYGATLEVGVALVLLAAAALARRGDAAAARLWLVLGLSTYALQLGLKALVARPRPALWSGGEWAVSPGSLAFPSGHALAAATFYPLLAWTLARVRPRLRTPAFAGAALLMLWIGLGRLYLGVHWPSDVVAGWALGLLQTAAGIRWVGPRSAT